MLETNLFMRCFCCLHEKFSIVPSQNANTKNLSECCIKVCVQFAVMCLFESYKHKETSQVGNILKWNVAYEIYISRLCF